MLSWLISDVPNDDPGVIGSGPTVADATTFADALAVLAKFEIEGPPAMRAHLEAGAAGRIEETPKPGDPRLARVETVMVATPRCSLEAAASMARSKGLEVVLLGDNLEGEARVLGAEHAKMAIERAQRGGQPTVILSGGEIPALAVVDAVVRLLPGAISDHESAATDSFYEGLLSPPSYTRPAEYRGMPVPPVLLSGDHAKIASWRREQAERLTRERRPDLWERLDHS